MKKLFLVDGTYELFRAFFGAPEHASPDGLEVVAVQGVLRSMIRLWREEQPTHIAVATDHVIESFRNDLFEYYKSGEGLDPILHNQFAPLEEGLAALGFYVFAMVEFEADDALAAAAHQFADQFDQVILASPDKDLMQCVNDKTLVWDRRREKYYDAEAVKEKMGVAPAAIADYLALVGDSADGIPGLSGWGAKSTATLLSEYNHIEQIPADFEKWNVKVRGGAKLCTTLQNEMKEALLYRKLATLRVDVPMPPLADLEFFGTNKSKWQAFCKKYGFERLLEAPLAWL